jgi:hypothetical protein
MRDPGWKALTFAFSLQLAAPALPTLSAQVPDWSYRRLDLEVTVDPSRSALEVRGSGVLELAGAPASEVRLFVNTRAFAMRFGSFTTTSPDARVELSTTDRQHLVRVGMASPAAPGDTLAVAFALSWEAPSMQVLLHDSIALASWVESWYPAVVRADGGRPRWEAPGTTRFDLPGGWHSVSNGMFRGREAVGDRGVEAWHSEEAVNRSFVAAPYRVARATAGGREIGVYLLKADTVSARRQAETLSRAIGAMEEVWGDYPYGGYAIAEIPDGLVTWAASSEQGFIMATSAQFGDDGNLPLFAHEAAHAWWGNRVGSHGPGQQLLTESLAQYGAVVAIEALEGADAMNEFLRFSRRGYNQFQSAHGYFEIIRRGGDKPLSRLAQDQWDHNLADSKGHWFHHMLRHRLGSDRYFEMLRGLQRDFAGGGLSLDEFRRIVVAAAPADPGMERFLGQWLDRTGAPVLEKRWWTLEAGRVVHLEIAQLQPEPYDLDLTLELELVNGQRLRRTVTLDAPRGTYRLDAHARVVGVRLDPDHRLLHWRPEYGPPPL